MARQALTLAGTIVGAWFGNPQLGYMVGAAVGGLVDPEVIKAPSMGDLSTQTSSEGVPCPLYAGTAGGAGNLVYVSAPDIVDGGTDDGKGGPQQELPDRAYVTAIVRIGASLFDGPGYRMGITGLIKVWEDEKLVYDVSPTSTILAESAEYAKGFTFYPGNQTQLPDPDVEAIEGVGNVSAYRGRAIFVKKRHDVTDRRGSLPSWRFEVSVNGVQASLVSLATNGRYYSGSPGALTVSDDPIGWPAGTTMVAVSPSGRYAAGVIPGGIGSGFFELRKYNDSDGSWSALSLPAVAPEKSPGSMAWSPNGLYLAVAQALYPDSADNWILYVQNGDTFTAVPPPAESMSFSGAPMAWNDQSNLLGIIRDDVGSSFAIYSFNGVTLTNRRDAPNFGDGSTARLIDFRPGSAYVAVATDTKIKVLTVASSPVVVAEVTAKAEGGLWWSNDGAHLIGVANDVTGDNEINVWAFDASPGSESLNLIGVAAMTDGVPTQASINPARTHLAIARSTISTIYPPAIYAISQGAPPTVTRLADPADIGDELFTVAWSGSPGVPQIEAGTTTYEQLVLAAGRRCKVPNAKWDLPGLGAKIVKGSVVASQGYTAQDYINALRWVFPSDGACYDGQIHIHLRGGTIDTELDEQYLVDEQDDSEQDEVLRNGDDRQTAPIRRPYKTNLMFPNARIGYMPTKATSPNYGDRGDAVSEVTLEIPVVVDETQAAQLADILDKIGRADAEGEVVRVFPENLAAKLVPGSLVRLIGDSLSRRMRVAFDRHGDGTVRLQMLVDRQYAYSSQATAQPAPAWPTPPPTLPGETTFVAMNLPALTDGQDLLGFHAALCGQPGTAWRGARIDYRVNGTTDWTSLGLFTRRAVMGSLLAPVAAASEFYTDTTNEVSVGLIGDDELLSISQQQFLSEGNPFALVYDDGTAEVLQFRDAADEGDREWTLTRLLRGRLVTVPGPHLTGARFVMLSGSIFIPLPSALIGKNLQFRVTSIGNTTETAPVYDFAWNPALSQTEFPAAHLFLERDGDEIHASAVPRHRFGTDDNPVASNNWTGYRWAATDGSNTATRETGITSPAAVFDTTGWATPITVTVALTNRFTGAGPAISEQVA